MKSLMILGFFLASPAYAYLGTASVKLVGGEPRVCAYNYSTNNNSCMNYSDYKRFYGDGAMTKSELKGYAGADLEFDEDNSSIENGLSVALNKRNVYLAMQAEEKAIFKAEEAIAQAKKVEAQEQKNMDKIKRTIRNRNVDPEELAAIFETDKNSPIFNQKGELVSSYRFAENSLTAAQANVDEAEAARIAAIKERDAALAEEKRKLNEAERKKAILLKRAKNRENFALSLKTIDVQTRLKDTIKDISDAENRQEQISKYYDDTLMGMYVRLKFEALEANFCTAAATCEKYDYKKKDDLLGIGTIFGGTKTRQWKGGERPKASQ
ncbi:hypothetical protein N9W41_01490 [bacterium]|nr:hypothetical protein [bacterium]